MAIGVFIAAISGTLGEFNVSGEDFLKVFSEPSLRTVLLIVVAVFVVYTVFSLLILPLRCWWQAYLFRYLVSRSRAGSSSGPGMRKGTPASRTFCAMPSRR